MKDTIAAVVPVKNIVDAKMRLRPVLSPAERRGLFAAMLEDVATVLCSVNELDGVYLVTRDPVAMALAIRMGLQVLEEPANRGHTEAVSFGAQRLAAAGLDGIVTVPADVPLATADEIRRVLNAHGPAPAVTIVPSGDEFGSNAVVCSPPGLLPFQFGDDSFRPHLAEARQLGVEPSIVRAPGLALDVDTPDDLIRFIATPSPTFAYAYLRKNGILDRLSQSNDRT